MTWFINGQHNTSLYGWHRIDGDGGRIVAYVQREADAEMIVRAIAADHVAEEEPTEAEIERVATVIGQAFWADGNAAAIALAAIIALRNGG